MTRRGGFFDQDASTTFQAAANIAAAGAEFSENKTKGDWVKDSFALASNLTLVDFPFQIPADAANEGNGYDYQASLGVGRNSTVLSMLRRAGHIGSRTWGLWHGLAGATKGAQMDGSLVLGGYDAAKIKSKQNHTGKYTEPAICESGMTVKIRDLVLNFPNGSNSNLLDPILGSSLIQACICPQCQNLMSIPFEPYYERFEMWTETSSINRSGGINFFTMMYPADQVYQGDLTITLDSGLSVRVPNSQLVLPDLTLSNSGQIVANTSEANPTTDTNLVAIIDDELERASTATTATAGPASTASEPPSAPTDVQVQRPEAGATLSGGAIGGMIAGAVAALVAVGILGFCLLRRRRRRDPPISSGQISGPQMQDWSKYNHDASEVYGGPPPELPGYQPPELPGCPPPPQELWTGRRSRVQSGISTK
ncbi:hypothetical protein H2201_001495 [Coniosporium apollinis]|uniref:Peptidase A1 domain-containing protein n=1 Tax=Coniosporium apollinis TaxID=61459 RepID=A0ABQ9P1F3_9PEZI|nr:hypothetical protein H2201_001495 [Coniosporium apollinis]